MKADAFIRKLDRISATSFLDGFKRRVGIEGLRLIEQQFATSTDPYGNAWPKLKRPRPGGPVEDKTGAMKHSALALPTPTGARWRISASYAPYQHFGTRTNPMRMLLPRGFLGLPRAWDAMVRAEAQRAFKEAFRA